MIGLSITRTELSLSALTVSDTGSSGYVLVSMNEGEVVHENVYAKSRWVDGARVTSTRRDVVTMELVVRVFGNSHANVMQNVDALCNALNQLSYTITNSLTGGGSRVYSCMPANYSYEWEPNEFRQYQVVVRASIPRQP